MRLLPGVSSDVAIVRGKGSSNGKGAQRIAGPLCAGDLRTVNYRRWRVANSAPPEESAARPASASPTARRLIPSLVSARPVPEAGGRGVPPWPPLPGVVGVAVGVEPLPGVVGVAVGVEPSPGVVGVAVAVEPPPGVVGVAVGVEPPPGVVGVAVGVVPPPGVVGVAVGVVPLPGVVGVAVGVEPSPSREQPFVLDIGEPPVLIGENNAPNPAEYLLHAIAGCLTVALVNVASARGVKLTRVESTVEGNIDLLGTLGLDEDVRNGYQDIRVTFHVEGDAPEEKLRELVERAQARSAMFDSISRGVPISVEYAA